MKRKDNMRPAICTVPQIFNRYQVVSSEVDATCMEIRVAKCRSILETTKEAKCTLRSERQCLPHMMSVCRETQPAERLGFHDRLLGDTLIERKHI
jgi:hypothetical protein